VRLLPTGEATGGLLRISFCALCAACRDYKMRVKKTVNEKYDHTHKHTHIQGVAIKKPDCFFYSFPATSMAKKRVGH